MGRASEGGGDSTGQAEEGRGGGGEEQGMRNARLDCTSQTRM